MIDNNFILYSDMLFLIFFFFFSSRRRHTRYWRDWSSDVCSSDLEQEQGDGALAYGDSGEVEAAHSGLRSEEHTSELQSRQYLVCRLLLEKKKRSARELQ